MKFFGMAEYKIHKGIIIHKSVFGECVMDHLAFVVCLFNYSSSKTVVIDTEY